MLERSKNQPTKHTKNNKKRLLINIILNYIHKDNVVSCAKVNGFESNGTTENEIFREIPDSLPYPSTMKTFILCGPILCNINLNCMESVQ